MNNDRQKIPINSRYPTDPGIYAVELTIQFCPQYLEFNLSEIIEKATIIHGNNVRYYSQAIYGTFLGGGFVEIIEKIESENQPLDYLCKLTARGLSFQKLNTFANLLTTERDEENRKIEIEELQYKKLKREVHFWTDVRWWGGLATGAIGVFAALAGIYFAWLKSK